METYFTVLAGAHQEIGVGEDQPQVHRHQLQIRTRPLPDRRRQGLLHGTTQEGPSA